MKKYVNGELVDMTSGDIAEASKITESINADIAKDAKEKADKEAEAEAKATLKASAKTKLMAGEALTEEEANELVGL